ncbi:hypothetical protein QR680_002450 [Steinernema hermaphroditum]|uniref:Histone deacetylase domain-containing protein n=1 Tax=Steinernema hermaphroditum TaxID=289476 RepID=A0AA39H2R7_9BILA|nr:hypothetical protein QR680_002450 [Steinernema hermaphroditum]
MDPSTYLDHLEGETISKKLLKKYGARGEEQHVASTCLCHNESASEKHNPPQRIADHPESHKRVAKILERLRETDLQSRCAILTEKDVEEIETDDLEGLVNGDYLSLLRELEESNQDQLYSFGGLFDSVYFTKETLQVARSAISLAYDATELVWNGLHANAALIVRPPGHHALRDAGNGFCVLNNVVLSAKHALKLGAQRILIVDFDVHHGQGVQRQFVDNDKVTYFSVHRYERGAFWPHLRESNYTFVGTGQGLGHTVNVPLSQIGATNADYMSIFWNVLYPLAMSLDPDMIFVSAGFDACYGDPLGEMNLTPDLYAHWMYHLRSLADGRVVMLLEGGYNHHNQALCVQRCIEALCGSTLAPLDAKSALSESCAADILNAVDVLKWHWPALNDGDPGVFDVRIKEMELARQRTIQALHEDTNDDSAVDFKEQDLLVGDRKRPKHLTSTELARLNFSRGREDTGNIEQHELPAFNRDDYALLHGRHTAKVGFAYDSSMTLHKSEFDSYENPKRISAVYEMLNGMGLVEKCKTIEGHEATEDELLRVHTAGHIEFVRNVTKSEHLSDSDLYCNEYTLNSALCAAGTLIKVSFIFYHLASFPKPKCAG